MAWKAPKRPSKDSSQIMGKMIKDHNPNSIKTKIARPPK